MKGYRFYEEYASARDKRKRNSAGRVIAVVLQEHDGHHDPIHVPGGDCVECISSVFDQANSAVCGSSASSAYLREQCRRIPEKRAREIHPALFTYLDNGA